MEIRKYKRVIQIALSLMMIFGLCSNIQTASATDEVVENNNNVEEVAAVNFTEAGPLLDPVVAPVKRRMAARTAVRTLNNTENTTRTTENQSGLILNKTSVWDAEQQKYKITLESYTTGTVSGGERIPSDIILVLDESGSMDFDFTEGKYELQIIDSNSLNKRDTYYIKDGDGNPIEISYDGNTRSWRYWSGSYYDGEWITVDTTQQDVYDYVYIPSVKRMKALKQAVTHFVSNVRTDNANYTEVPGKITGHRISIVGFSSGVRTRSELVSCTDNRIDTAINSLTTDGATRADLGLERANSIFGQNPITKDNGPRNRVVIMFTDGQPTSSSNYDPEVAGDAVDYAKTLKNTYGATVYSIGIFDGADPTEDVRLDNDNNKENRYMHGVSSNYPTAQANSSWRSASGVTLNEGSNAGYYLTCNNESELNNIFTSISEQIQTPAINLGEETTVKDVVSDYFQLPAGFNANNVTVETVAYQGNNTWANVVETVTNPGISIDGNTIKVNGFDYDANFIRETADESGFKGKKLVISFYVEPKNGFIGGNSVPTNGETSGIYKSEKSNDLVTENSKFNVPVVDVDVNYEFKNTDTAIYITNELDNLFGLIDTGKYNYGSNQVENVNVGYTLDGTNNKYVDVVYEIKDGDKLIAKYTVAAGQTSGTWEMVDFNTANLRKNKQYTVSATITPNPTTGAEPDGHDTVVSKTVNGSNNNGISTLYVLVPSVQSSDSEMFLGDENENLQNHIAENATWTIIGGNETPTCGTSGTKPELTFEISTSNEADSSQVKNDLFTPEEVKRYEFEYDVMIGNNKITEFTKVNHNDTPSISNETTDCNTNHFFIRVKGGTIDIFKKLINPEKVNLDDGDPIFIFQITGNGNTYYRQIRLSSDDLNEKNHVVNPLDSMKKTLVDLPKGEYTITELPSLRYNFKRLLFETQEITSNTVTVTIGRDNPDREVTFENEVKSTDYFSDNDIVVNKFGEIDENGNVNITQEWFKEPSGAQPQN